MTVEKKQKVALVTGSSRGIGAACALMLGRHGFKVAVHYRSQEKEAMEVCSRIEGAEAFQADLSQTDACQELIKKVKARFGSIDVLVNNAGVALDQLIPFAKLEDFESSVATNLRATFLLTKLVSKMMIKQKSGSIINMTSVVAHTGNAGQSLYAATKGAMTGFSKSVAIDLASFGIRCNCVAPGFIQTDMTASLEKEAKEAIFKKIPMQRLGLPEEVAEAVLFLASDASSYITGSTLHVNGGMFPN
ncbi:MAG: beta-ketoacyl-ACP reductase [Oligoflexales bacterium]|nr:beta-ketoacyl-ACP reductase [Oligoflexales bacterium]